MRAFPMLGGNISPTQKGMELRDFFAAAALQGIIVSAEVASKENDLTQDVAKAYEYADAMMKAREAGKMQSEGV